MTTTFKPTPPTEVSEIRELAQQIWPHAFKGVITPEQIDYMIDWMYSIEQLKKEVENEGVHYDRIYFDNKLCGYTAYGPADRPHYLKLHKIYLQPDLQRKGIGKATLERILNYATANNYTHIELRVNRDNTQAVNAYKKYGFFIEKEDKADIGNGFVMDDYVMVFRIQDSED